MSRGISRGVGRDMSRGVSRGMSRGMSGSVSRGMGGSLLALILMLLSLSGFAEMNPVKVEIRQDETGFSLYRGGQPYIIRGAGTQTIEDLESLVRYGGNSIRTWNSENAALLDRAHELGLTVALCLNVMRERHGFDYDDPAAVREQFEYMRSEVLRHRNHPALLTWVIGNELNYDFSNPRVYDAVNEISRMIHELDPNHPTTTTTAGMSKELAAVIAERAPDLDFISVQFYGGLFDLEDIVADIGFDKPLMVTEWGTIGHWEVPATEWGAPMEMNSHAKADTYLRGFNDIISPLSGQLIGNYVFLWGHKQERTPTWYGMFTPGGYRTEAVDVMRQIWTGAAPDDRAPVLDELRLNNRLVGDNVRLRSGEQYSASVKVTDEEQSRLSYSWRLMAESEAQQTGGDEEQIPEDMSSLIQEQFVSEQGLPAVNLEAPGAAGAYRLFVYVMDEAGGAAHANIPFYVDSEGGI